MEAHCLRRLERSQFVARLFWDFDSPGRWIGILELCFGELWNLIRHRGSLLPAETSWYASQMVEALAACHAAGIVHRDVKCENFLVGEEGRGKLNDKRSDLWSLGCAIYQLILGTPPFNAPTPFL